MDMSESHYTFAGSYDEIKKEMAKMMLIDAINDAKELDELIESFGLTATRKMLDTYAHTDLSNDIKTKNHAIELWEELLNKYPVDKFPEKWI
jgi:hypothetical protein